MSVNVDFDDFIRSLNRMLEGKHNTPISELSSIGGATDDPRTA